MRSYYRDRGFRKFQFNRSQGFSARVRAEREPQQLIPSVAPVLRSRSSSTERGSGTILGLAVLTMPFVVTAGLLYSGSYSVAHTRAELAADLSALAAADTMVGRAPGIPCEEASQIATSNGAVLMRCSVEKSAVTVTVQVDFGGYILTGSARAGPSIPSLGSASSVHALSRSSPSRVSQSLICWPSGGYRFPM